MVCVMVLNCFSTKNPGYTSIAGIIRKFGFYDIAVEILATMIISLQTFIWLIHKMIFHMRHLCKTMLQISKLKHMNFIKWNKMVLLTLKGDIIKIKLDCNVESLTRTLHVKMSTSWILMKCHHLLLLIYAQTWKKKPIEWRIFL